MDFLSEGPENIDINPKLQVEEKHNVLKLVKRFSDVLTDLPGNTNILEYDIKILSENPTRVNNILFHTQ